MASIGPRASAFWSTPSRMSFASDLQGDGADDDIEGFEVPDELDGRTPLDKTIDRIGMGSYQWTLLSLCGFGWLADNMWIQAVAIVLPRVQQHFSVGDTLIGTLSSSMFAGMMFGAVGWGTCSDLMGRTTAFNATLFLTSLFGIFASLANSFIWLCAALFFLGSAVGGSMPTDGTLLLEHMPNGKQYLVTALSVFFSFGAVLAAVVALLVIPSHSCTAASAPCDVKTDNLGWKYLLVALGGITLAMFLARIVFFRLHESPRFLVHAGRPQEAVESLQLISKFNGSELSLDLEDVADAIQPSPPPPKDEPSADTALTGTDPIQHDPEYPPVRSTNSTPTSSGEPNSSRTARPDAMQYSAMAEPGVALDGHTFGTPLRPPNRTRLSNPFFPPVSAEPSEPSESATAPFLASDDPEQQQSRRPRPSGSRRHSRRLSTASLIVEKKSSKYCACLPRWMRRSAVAWVNRVSMVLEPEWLKTTLLVWAVWFAMSLAYTMFNVFLPKLLETRSMGVDLDGPPKSLEDSLWDVVVYSLGGCPGALLGAWLIESPLGRRWSLAGSTFATAFFCWVFVVVEQSWAVRLSTIGISLSATAMWAVLYGWTPEIFGTKVRGTACGIASALSRIGGMIAPILGGTLLTIDRSFPVYTSIVVFVIAGACVLWLEENSGDSGGERILVH